MGFSSGTFTYTGSSTTFTAPTTGTTISSTAAAAAFSETATGLGACLLKDGTQTVTGNIPMATFKFTGLGAGTANGDSLRYQQLFTTSAVTLLGAMDWVTGANIASAATVNLTTATGNAVHVTGTTTITAVTLGTGMWRLVIFDGALTLTHHATNNHLPGGANITTAANDRALYWSDGTTVYCIDYVRSNTVPVQAASDTAAGVIEYAIQSEMETGSSTTLAVTPGRQHFHPSASKGWVKFNGTGTVAINASYNVTSITDNGTGDYTINWTTAFSSADYACGWMTNSNVSSAAINTQLAGSLRVVTSNTEGTGAAIDLSIIQVIAFGDL